MEKMMTCPYDSSHSIRASRFEYHILKCKLDNPPLATCPFNNRHKMNMNALRRHMPICPDKERIANEKLFKDIDGDAISQAESIVLDADSGFDSILVGINQSSTLSNSTTKEEVWEPEVVIRPPTVFSQTNKFFDPTKSYANMSRSQRKALNAQMLNEFKEKEKLNVQ
jgi:hypothetical protein